MNLALSQSVTALSPNMTASVTGVGGIPPYTYSVLPNGAGGTIDAVSGIYTAPAVVNPNPKQASDIIQVTDSATKPATATGSMLVANVIGLFCDILQNEMGIASDHIYFWDQKIFQPTDSSLYIAVSIPSCKPFSNIITTDGSGIGLNSVQSINMLATFDIDAISRGPEARDRKEEIILALNSIYAQSQQETNSFYIGKLPPGSRFLNLSFVDGAAIPYRFKISVNVQYAITKTKAVPYFDTFLPVQATINA